MEKEKQIEDLAEAIYKSGVAIEGTDMAFGLYDTDTHFHRMAAKLYSAGYNSQFVREDYCKRAIRRMVEALKASKEKKDGSQNNNRV